jgi:membrane associated rhomboid family serine protease
MGEMVLPSSAPTPAAVLRWIAAKGEPWFPSRHAAETGTDRDSLDEPLTALRLAGLVRVETWVRGVGQGYVLTPEGREAADAGPSVPILTAGATELPAAPPPPADSPEADRRVTSRLGLDPRPPLIVPLLLVANVLCFFVGLVGAIRGEYPVGRYLTESHPYLLHKLGAVSGDDLLRGEWWRLFTSCFVHIGGLHLLVNLFALAMMGPLAELLWGRWRLALIYTVSGLAGSCLAMAVQPGVTLAGASGAIWGLLASLAAWLLLFRRQLPTDVAGDWARRLWLVFILNAGVSFLPGISWQAHLGGGVAGFLTAWLLNAVRFRTGRRRLVALALLLALPAACFGCLFAAIKWSGRWEEHRQRYVARQAAEARKARQAEIERERLAVQERQAQFVAAVRGYLKDVGAHLDRVSPQVVTPVEERAKYQLIRVGERRKAGLADLRAEVNGLKESADAVANHPDDPATGPEGFAQFRDRARTFAKKRSESLAMLLKMLDAPDAPAAATWAAWNESRRAANELWKTLARP